MNELYLVINTQTHGEKWVLDICTSYEIAEMLSNRYKTNFKEALGEECDFIEIEAVSTDGKILWSYDK